MLVLHICPHGSADWVRDGLRQSAGSSLRIQTVSSIDAALARISGGGVALALLDLSAQGDRVDGAVAAQLERRAGDVALQVLATEAESFPGAGTTVLTKADASRLPELLLEAAKEGVAREQASLRSDLDGKVLAFVGVKGGVGATTTALNVAAILSLSSPAAMAEIRSDRGALCERLGGDEGRGGIGDLLAMPPETINAPIVEQHLWETEDAPGLRILSAPGAADPSLSLSRAHAKALTQGLRRCAQTVILDLPWDGGEAMRAAAQEADLVVVVIEQTPFAVSASRRTFQALRDWRIAPKNVRAVLVNRCPIPNPPPIEEIRSRIPAPIAAFLPPAAEVCAESESLRALAVRLRPDELVSLGYEALASDLKGRLDARSRRSGP